jgi:hypothetical protein
VDAKLSGFIGSGRHDTAVPRLRADDHRSLPILGMIALFTARKKSIEIDVGDPAGRFCGGFSHIGILVSDTELLRPSKRRFLNW